MPPVCSESLKALGGLKEPGQKFECYICGRRVTAIEWGEHVVVSRHRWPTDRQIAPEGRGHPLYGHRTSFLKDDSVWCYDCGGVVAVADG